MWPSWLWVRHAYKLLHSTKFLHKFGMVEFVVTLLVFLLFNFIFFSISSVLILTFFSDSVPVLGDGVPRVVPLVVGPEVEAAAVLSSCCSGKGVDKFHHR